MGAVRLQGVRKSFGSFEAVRGVDLDIAEGEFCVLLGPSGCGKSTLLRMIAGLEDVTAGTIAIGGRDVTDREPNERDVAMVFQSYALYPHMTVRDNMGFALRLARRPRAEIDAAVAQAASILGLSELLARYPRELSGGQRQRVAMGRAIVRNPKVFLFDEPLSNLDAKLRVQMRVEIARLHQRLGNTAVYVTHDQVEAMTMADRIVVMREGRIEQVGTPLSVYDRPANLFVATFIGAPAINLLDGELVARAGASLVTGDGFALPLPGGAAGTGGKVKVGIRPEHIAAGAANGTQRMTVTLTEPLGREAIVHGQLGRSEIAVLVGGRDLPAVGDTIPVSIDAAQIHLFDPQTGARVGA